MADLEARELQQQREKMRRIAARKTDLTARINTLVRRGR